MNIRFGIVSDPQYSDIEDHRGRQYRQSLAKLKLAVSEFNKQDLDFVVQLGDMIDHGFKSYKPVLDVWKTLKHSSNHVLGNHDFCVGAEYKKEVLKTLGMNSSYYSFSKGDFRFIFLNGNGLSFNAFEEDSEMHKSSEEYWQKHAGESEWWNGAIDQEQLTWFKEELHSAESHNQKALVFCHYPLIGEARFVLWNSREVLEVIESSPAVKVWMNGHFHEGRYEFKNSIHHMNMKGMVQFGRPTFSIVELNDQALKIEGFGSEESRILKI